MTRYYCGNRLAEGTARYSVEKGVPPNTAQMPRLIPVVGELYFFNASTASSVVSTPFAIMP